MIGVMIAKDIASLPAVLPEPREYYQGHAKRLAEICFELARDGQKIDLASVVSKLSPGEHDAMDAAVSTGKKTQRVDADMLGERTSDGLLPWLADGLSYASTLPIDSIRNTAKTIKDHALRRQLMATCMETCDEAATTSDPDALRLELRNSLDGLGSETIVEADIPLSIAEVIRKSDDPLPQPKIKTFFDLDEKLNGLDGGEMIVVAARPGMGKTAFACQLILNALSAGKKVDFWSLEMPAKQILKRMILNRIECDVINRSNSGAALQIGEELARQNLRIFDVPSPSMSAIENATRIRRPDLVVLDYLQLMPGDRRLDRHLQVAELSKFFKDTSRRFDCPVVPLCQLNREVEKRSDKRPMLSDLRESGALEQDADKVVFLYRESYYSDKTAIRGAPSLTEVIVAKHRNGPVGTVELIYKPAQHRFEMQIGQVPQEVLAL